MLDASPVLALLRNEPGAGLVEQVLLSAGAVASAVNWAEVLTRLVEDGEDVEGAALRLAGLSVPGATLAVYPFDEAQARVAAGLRPATRRAGLSLADRACLALAATLDLPAVTADRAWAQLQMSVQVRLIR